MLGMGPLSIPLFLIVRLPDYSYSIGYGNSQEEALDFRPTCAAYEQHARDLGRTDLYDKPCGMELIGVYQNAVVPEGRKDKRQKRPR